MTDVTFSEWLTGQRWRDDPVGDLAADVAHDPEWPWEHDEDVGVLHRHLFGMGACDEAHDALDHAYDEWGKAALA